MRTMWRGVCAIAVAMATMGSTCDDSDTRVTGTYQLSVFESQDTCDQELNQFGSSVTITALSGGGYTVNFGGQGELTGDFSDEGVLVAQGVVDDQGDGKTTTMLVGLVIRQGALEGTGRLTYNGTFPGNSGACFQEFGLTGSRADNRAPVIG